jgi:D-beta-D-heptose 7-phosphate kinase/D-beta-D-heptose 1-phosphate adenosyltransferase
MKANRLESVLSIPSGRVQEIISRFKSTRVMIVGDVMLDVYLQGSVDRISPEAPVPVMKVVNESMKLGGAANVANNIAALGSEPVLVGVIGNDGAGKKLSGKLKDLGMSEQGLLVDESRPTSRKTRVLAGNQQVVRVDREADQDVATPISGKLVEYVGETLESCDAILLQDYNKGVLTGDVIRSIISMARDANKIVTVDPKFHNFFEYRGVTLFKPNIREMEYAFGSIPADSGGLEMMVKELKDRIDSQNVLLTCGADGMTLLDENGGISRIPAINREVYDVSGAGDTVISTITVALSAGGAVMESSILASYAASIEVQRRGVSTVSQGEILGEMRRLGGLIED